MGPDKRTSEMRGVVKSCDCGSRSLKKNINDLSHKISEMASRSNGQDQQEMEQLSDELQKQQALLLETK